MRCLLPLAKMQSWVEQEIPVQQLLIIKTRHSQISKYMKTEKHGMQCLQQSDQSNSAVL